MQTQTMTKGERDDLQRLIRHREKAQKSAAKLRSRNLLADFENQIAAEYSFDDDAVWTAAQKAAEAEVAKAQKRVAAQCQELGIPERFAPSLQLHWVNRGYDNLIERRRNELRRVAESRVAALEQEAVVEIELASVEAQTEIAIAGLTSEAARAFVERLPTVESLMPALDYAALAGEADPPIIEQLISPNALRQRRFRERQKTLRNADVTPKPALSNTTDDAEDDEAA